MSFCCSIAVMLNITTHQNFLTEIREHDLKDNTIPILLSSFSLLAFAFPLVDAHVSLRSENLIQFQLRKSINPGFYYTAMADTFFVSLLPQEFDGFIQSSAIDHHRSAMAGNLISMLKDE
jgi:hypothetical protein